MLRTTIQLLPILAAGEGDLSVRRPFIPVLGIFAFLFVGQGRRSWSKNALILGVFVVIEFAETLS
jgi:hypothetical protein